jgi:UDP-glucose-4-epimerase GalE
VAHVEDAYAAAGGGGQHFVEVIADQREDGVDAQPRCRFDKQLRSAWHRSILELVSLKILVTGGAGYIGAHTVRLLLDQGHDVTVVDNLSKGYRHNVPAGRLDVLDLADTSALAQLMREKRPQAVIHFAAFIAVGESMREPERYFANNVGGSLSLLTAMVQADVKHVVFSSTAAVYGNPHSNPILETFPIQPVSPYGESKVMVETLLRWFDQIHHLTSVSLRYFNASGADPAGQLGEEHQPETHLLPLLLRAVITGSPITVFGDDYDTPDGTCIRDYIHVTDLAQAHILAVEYLLSGGATDQFNVGTGAGHTVMEMIRVVEEVTGQKVPYVIGPRREGDPLSLVAAAGKLRTKLGWRPQYTELRTIVEHAWRFAKGRPPAER